MHPQPRTQPVHATAAILSIGDELTLGQTLNTNSKWLAEQLLARGIVCVEHVTVPDDLPAHVRTLERLADSVDLILSSGGLGPTADDLTRQAVSQAAADPLIEDPESLRQIEAFYAARSRTMPPLNRVQALRPAQSVALPNPHGTAPGFVTQIKRAECFCLPGPPGELFPMFHAQVAPRLRPPADLTVRTLIIGTVGLGESDIATRLGPLMARDRNPLVGTTASGGVVSCLLRYEGPLSPQHAERQLEEDRQKICALLGPHVFAIGHNLLARAIVERLTAEGKTLAVVESCTGGLLGGALTEIPGSSAAFLGGFLTYTNALKTALAQVPPEMFAPDGPGAVSAACAQAMARGGQAATGADYCLSVTGIAGPGGATPGKPVGTVWIALAVRNSGTPPAARSFAMVGERSHVRAWSVSAALTMLWLQLQGRPDIKLLRQTS